GRVHARIMRGEQNSAPTNAVEVGDLHDRVIVVDRVVGVAPAAIRADIKIGVAAGFPVAAVRRKLGRLDPLALLKTQDLHSRFSRSAMSSAMATVVKWVLARGTSGIIEASITRNPVHPITRHS